MRHDDDLLSLADVAKVTSYGMSTLRKMITAGEFPQGFRAPKQYRWQWRDVRRWIERMKEVELQNNQEKK